MGTDSERYGVGNVNVIIDRFIDSVLGMDRIRMWYCCLSLPSQMSATSERVIVDDYGHHHGSYQACI
jgi:hypothetical protein